MLRDRLGDDLRLTDTDEVIDSITGKSITGGGVEHDGMHLYLDDGRVIIILGVFYVGYCEKETLQ